MKKLLKTGFLIAFICGSYAAFCQPKDGEKMQEVFMTFISRKLSLSSQELSQMRPLVESYFRDTRKTHRQFTDPLVREQQKIELKLRYRKQFIAVIGNDRSNRFFAQEQLFRKRVREELKQREKQQKVNQSLNFD